MRRDLNVRFDGINMLYDWYVTGQDLLTMVQAAAQSMSGRGTPPATSGLSQAAAWRLDDHGAWVGAWQRLLTDKGLISKDIFFLTGGRSLKKSLRSQHTGDGFYMSDVSLAGTGPNATGDIWSRSDGASYREYGRFMHDNMPVAPMEQAVWSKKIAGKLRQVLNGAKDYSGKGAADVQSALPVLAVTMFLAEPARNPREWVIGLMMLDLIGEEYSATATHGSKRYLMDSVLAHPDRIDRSKGANQAPSKPQAGPDRQRYHKDRGRRVDDPQGLAPVANVTGLAKVEGKYPASPGGSAATSAHVDVANDYIQMKEASIACRWVASRLNAGLFEGLDAWSAIPLKAGTRLAAKRALIDVARNAVSPTRQGCAREVWDEIRRLINARAVSFD